MINPNDYSHNAKLEELVDIICQKTQREDREFFRMVMLYFIAKTASSQRVKVSGKAIGTLPVNMYTIGLAVSGFGKNKCIGIIREAFLSQFNHTFNSNIFPTVSDRSVQDYARTHHSTVMATSGSISLAEYTKTVKEFYNSLGVFTPQFGDATPAAIKQYHQKLILADVGDLSLQIDEIGSNLLKSSEILNLYLELYDEGITEHKLLKSTKDNFRTVVVEGKAPANMLLFGTPSKLLDGGVTEKEFTKFLDAGYARRCFFALSKPNDSLKDMTETDLDAMATAMFNDIANLNNSGVVSQWSDYFGDMASFDNHNLVIEVPDSVSIQLNKYQLTCKVRSDKIAGVTFTDSLKKTEIFHRYFKALKAAGALAFLEGVTVMTEQILNEAIKLVEESGESFNKILKSEDDHVKLGKYLATIPKDKSVTQAELKSKLPFFTGYPSVRDDMIELAMDWAADNNILIKSMKVGKSMRYYSEILEQTDPSKCILSVSDQLAGNYTPRLKSFDELLQLGQLDNLQWCNHTFIDDHRSEATANEGFNLLVLDIDGTANRDSVHHILQDYKFMTHTTKSNTVTKPSFRLVIPIKFVLRLNQDDYKSFMKNLISYLPFECDTQSIDRSRKWTMYKTSDPYLNNLTPSGKEIPFLDPLRFLPSTDTYDNHCRQLVELTDDSLNSLQKWFILETKEGNRNSMFFRYGALLLDSGKNLSEIEEHMLQVNTMLAKLQEKDPTKVPLPLTEIKGILTSLARK